MKTAEEYKDMFDGLNICTKSPSAIKVSAYNIIDLIMKDIKKEKNA